MEYTVAKIKRNKNFPTFFSQIIEKCNFLLKYLWARIVFVKNSREKFLSFNQIFIGVLTTRLELNLDIWPFEIKKILHKKYFEISTEKYTVRWFIYWGHHLLFCQPCFCDAQSEAG
jgi:hypothetical protein